MTRARFHAELSLSRLDNISGLGEVRLWGALHHERLNGKGYPLGLRGDQISLPSRIMAVADVFTALMEDRPYRRGMSLDKAVEILQSMEDNGHLDGNVPTTLRGAAGQINKVRIAAQHRARWRFDELYRRCAEPVENNVRLENAKVHALNSA